MIKIKFYFYGQISISPNDPLSSQFLSLDLLSYHIIQSEKMKLHRAFFLVFIPCVLILCSLAAYRFGSLKGLFHTPPESTISFERYSLTKTEAWPLRFDFQEAVEYNSERREISGTRENFLVVSRGNQEYLIEYDAEIDLELISGVREIREKGDESSYDGRYFLVQYQRFVEIVFFQGGPKATGAFQAQICLQLPISSSDNVRYHMDSHSNIWIVTASMNKVVFIQVYSCQERKLIAQFRHVLEEGLNVNEVVRIKAKGECMGIQVVTYGLDVVQLEVCPYHTGRSITENKDFRRSHKMQYEKVTISKEEYGVLQGNTKNIFREQLQRIIEYIYNSLTFSPTSAQLQDRPPSSEQHKKEPFDSMTVDEQNHYLLDFSGESACSGVKALNRAMINAKQPLFHGRKDYDRLGVLQILDAQYRNEEVPDVQHTSINAGLNTTRRATYKAAYRTYPDFKVEHLGITSKMLIFHPSEKLEQEDYTFVRTHEGGLVSQGHKFKGTFDKLPAEYEEAYQRVDTKAQEVVPGIFQVHVGYFNLMTYLIRSRDGREFTRVQLLNMLGGKPVLSHYISVKEGFGYVSTMLLNNQWWVLEYNRAQKRSMATKYELYANASSPTAILNVKRVYGVVGSEEHLNGEDDLAQLMSEFIQETNGGYILLNVYRCIDEYYYVEYSDAKGEVFGVARLHFKSLSNRRIKKSKKYSGQFERILLVSEAEMIPERYSRKPLSVYIKKANVFTHLPAFLQGNDPKQSWQRYCEGKQGGRSFRRLQKLGGFHYFPISHYAVGGYGCDYASDKSHSEQFMVFNLRSLIIDGKQQREGRWEVRREIILTIIGGSLGYILLAALIGILTREKGEGKGKKEKTA